MQELGGQGSNNRVITMRDTKTGKLYVLKVFGSSSKYTAEMGAFSRLKGPFFVAPICTMDVMIPVKVGGLLDTLDADMEQLYLQTAGLEPGQAAGRAGARYRMATLPAILMEHVDGMPADEWAFEVGRAAGMTHELRVQEAYSKISLVLAELFTAITDIHASGLVYHDVKPQNLMVRDGHLVMLDFDSSSDRSEPYRGSRPTAAPEQWASIRGNLHNGADMWSFGATSAILLAAVCAGMYWEHDQALSRSLQEYTPLGLVDTQPPLFVMQPPPTILSAAARQFLYPFFSEDTDSRRFNTYEQQQKIRELPFVASVPWETIRAPQISSRYHRMTEDQLRAELLAATPMEVPRIDQVIDMRVPQMVYRYEDQMLATDTEDPAIDPETGESTMKLHLVAALVGLPVARRLARQATSAGRVITAS